MWAKLLWLKWGEELSTLLAVLPASPFSLLKIFWLHEIRFETTGLQCQDQLLSWYSSQAGSGPWGLSSTLSAMHTLCRVDKSLNKPYSALSHMLEGPLVPTLCCIQRALSHPSRWAQMSPCLWNPFWLQAELVTLSSGSHASDPIGVSSSVCFASHLPPSTTSSWKARAISLVLRTVLKHL